MKKKTINICSKENVKNMRDISVGNNKTKKNYKRHLFFPLLDTK